jgi:hypothetical protein
MVIILNNSLEVVRGQVSRETSNPQTRSLAFEDLQLEAFNII